MKSEHTAEPIERPVNISMGRGLFHSTMTGAMMAASLPNTLQIPNAVPQIYCGKMNGVDT